MSGHERSDSPDFPESPKSPGALEDVGLTWPADFTADEKQFAAEMRELFPIEDEVLPPLYVQTLLDDELRAPLGRGYTRRLAERVMRRLGLPNRSLTPRRGILGLMEGVSLHAMTEPVRRAGTPVIAALSLLMALVIGTVYLATPSFAEGLRLLLGQTGAQQLNGYPANVTKSQKPTKSPRQASKPSAPMPVFWLGPVLGGYSYMGMSLIDQQDWSNGPLVEIQYALTQPVTDQPPTLLPASTNGQAAHLSPGGSGLLDIREFQVSSAYKAVLLAVQDGSATPMSVNGEPAVYVDGMWIVTQGGRKMWQSGTRSMLIFQHDGVIFWITGDQRDGMNAYSLTQVASALMQTSLATLRPNRLSTHFSPTSPDADLRPPLGANSDVLDVIERGSDSNAPTSEFVTLNMPDLSLMN